jgi:hypothetical protein
MQGDDYHLSFPVYFPPIKGSVIIVSLFYPIVVILVVVLVLFVVLVTVYIVNIRNSCYLS